MIAPAVIDPSTAEGVAHLPPGADEIASAMFVMPAVGFNAVSMAGVAVGDTVVVHGMGPIGLGALLAAGLRGAVTVGVDINQARLQLARERSGCVGLDARPHAHIFPRVPIN